MDVPQSCPLACMTAHQRKWLDDMRAKTTTAHSGNNAGQVALLFYQEQISSMRCPGRQRTGPVAEELLTTCDRSLSSATKTPLKSVSFI